MYQKLLVPMALDHDISPQTLEIARALGTDTAEIIAIHVYDTPQGTVSAYLDDGAIAAGYERAKQRLQDKTRDWPGVRAELIEGHTYRSIIDYARANRIDCIVMGSQKPGLGDYLLGSTAARVVRHAPCAVHVYRR